jgi:hypothetical protein
MQRIVQNANGQASWVITHDAWLNAPPCHWYDLSISGKMESFAEEPGNRLFDMIAVEVTHDPVKHNTPFGVVLDFFNREEYCVKCLNYWFEVSLSMISDDDRNTEIIACRNDCLQGGDEAGNEYVELMLRVSELCPNVTWELWADDLGHSLEMLLYILDKGCRVDDDFLTACLNHGDLLLEIDEDYDCGETKEEEAARKAENRSELCNMLIAKKIFCDAKRHTEWYPIVEQHCNGNCDVEMTPVDV